MSSISKSFVIRKLKGGDIVYLIRDIIDSSGNGSSILQTYSENEDTYYPDWSVEANQPIIKLEAISSNGISAIITSCSFTYDGEELIFDSAAGTDGWIEENATSPRFAYKIEDGKSYIKVLDNLSEGDGSNKILSYRVIGSTSDGSQFTISGASEFIFPITSPGTYWIQITTDHTTLGLVDGDTEITSCTLSVNCGMGTSEVENGKVNWYKNNTIYQSNLDISDTISLTRDDVNGSEVFSAELFLPDAGNTVVARDGITIYDVADEYLVAYKVTSGDGTVSDSKSTTLSPYILKNLQEINTPDGTSFENEIYNASGVLVRTVSGNSVTISQSDCLYTQSGSTEYGDVEVRCTASW